jgi:hypothetical protein
MVVRTLLALLVIALLLAGLHAALRALPRIRTLRRRGRFMEALETLQLAPGCALHAVRVADRYFVIGTTHAGTALVCEIPAEGVARRE